MDTKHELWLLYKELEDLINAGTIDLNKVEDIKDKLGEIINAI